MEENQNLNDLIETCLSVNLNDRETAQNKLFKSFGEQNHPEAEQKLLTAYSLELKNSDGKNLHTLLLLIFKMLSLLSAQTLNELLIQVIEKIKLTDSAQNNIAFCSSLVDFLSAADSKNSKISKENTNALFELLFSGLKTNQNSETDLDEFKAFCFGIKSFSEHILNFGSDTEEATRIVIQTITRFFEILEKSNNHKLRFVATSYISYALENFKIDNFALFQISSTLLRHLTKTETSLPSLLQITTSLWRRLGRLRILSQKEEKDKNNFKISEELKMVSNQILSHLGYIYENHEVLSHSLSRRQKYLIDLRSLSLESISNAVSHCGPELVYESIPILVKNNGVNDTNNKHNNNDNKNGKNYEIKMNRIWVLKVLKSSVKNASLLGYFKNIYPLVSLLQLQSDDSIKKLESNELCEDEDGKEMVGVKASKLFKFMVLECLVTFCKSPKELETPSDLREVFSRLGQVLDEQLNDGESFKTVIRAIKNVFESSINASLKEECVLVFQDQALFFMKTFCKLANSCIPSQKPVVFSLLKIMVKIAQESEVNAIFVHSVENINKDPVFNGAQQGAFLDLICCFCARKFSAPLSQSLLSSLLHLFAKLQVKAYKKLYNCIGVLMSFNPSCFDGNEGTVIKALLSQSSPPNALRPKLECFSLILKHSKPGLGEYGREHLPFLNDVVLATKEKNIRTRKAALQYIEALSEAILSNNDSQIYSDSIFNVLLAKMAKSNSNCIKSGAIETLKTLFSTLSTALPAERRLRLVRSVLSALSPENTRIKPTKSEIPQNSRNSKTSKKLKKPKKRLGNVSSEKSVSKSAFSFLRVVFSKMAKSETDQILPEIMQFVTLYLSFNLPNSDSNGGGLKVKPLKKKMDIRESIKPLLQRLIKRYGADTVKELLPVEKRTIVRNIQRKMTKRKFKKEVSGAADEMIVTGKNGEEIEFGQDYVTVK